MSHRDAPNRLPGGFEGWTARRGLSVKCSIFTVWLLRRFVAKVGCEAEESSGIAGTTKLSDVVTPVHFYSEHDRESLQAETGG